MSKSTRLVILTWAVLSALALTFGDAVADAACPQVGFTVVEPHASSQTRPIKISKSQTIYLRRVPITTTQDITDIKLGGNDYDAVFQLKFTPAATKRLIDATNNHAGRRIAFMFDNEVLTDIVIPGSQGLTGEGAEVSIRHGMQVARTLMRAIQGCTGAPTTASQPH